MTDIDAAAQNTTKFMLKEEQKNSLIQFCNKNNLPLDAYELDSIYRFIRINPKLNFSEEVLKSQLPISTELNKINWLPGFYSLPSNISISELEAYKSHQIYGIDASSGAVVKALDPDPEDHILDLCCAPGSKLCMIGDVMITKIKNDSEQGEFLGSITGVDINEESNMCKKYKIQNVRLFLDDASQFKLLAPIISDTTVSKSIKRKFEEISNEDCNIEDKNENNVIIEKTQIKIKSKKWKRNYAKKRSNGQPSNLLYCNNWKFSHSSNILYDKILLDAQCTLDASVRHLLQYEKIGWNDPEQSCKDVEQLQKAMILNAFSLLKKGGVMVYSTCSFCKSQNEEIIQYLLSKNNNAVLVPIPSLSNSPGIEGSLPNTLRFYPKYTHTSGMFIAKILKQ